MATHVNTLYFLRNVLSEIKKAVSHDGDSFETIDKKIMVALRLICSVIIKPDDIKEFYKTNGGDADDIVDEVFSDLYENEIIEGNAKTGYDSETFRESLCIKRYLDIPPHRDRELRKNLGSYYLPCIEETAGWKNKTKQQGIQLTDPDWLLVYGALKYVIRDEENSRKIEGDKKKKQPTI